MYMIPIILAFKKTQQHYKKKRSIQKGEKATRNIFRSTIERL